MSSFPKTTTEDGRTSNFDSPKLYEFQQPVVEAASWFDKPVSASERERDLTNADDVGRGVTTYEESLCNCFVFDHMANG